MTHINEALKARYAKKMYGKTNTEQRQGRSKKNKRRAKYTEADKPKLVTTQTF